MVRCVPLLALAALFPLAPTATAAAAGGSAPDVDRRGRSAPLPERAARAFAPDGGTTSRLTATHQYEFWQEAEPLAFDSRTRDAVCVDLDGDGSPELARLGIAFGDPYGGTLGLTRGGPYGPAGGEFQQFALPSPRSVRAADLDGDGRMDLIAAHLRPIPGVPNQFVRCATLFIQSGASGAGIEFLDPAPVVDLAPGGELVLLADVDFDDVPDLVSTGTGHELHYQQGLGPAPGGTVPRFSAQPVNLSEQAARTAGLPRGSSFQFGFANDLVGGDFDGDGTTDLAVAAGSAIGGGVHAFYHRAAGWTYERFDLAPPGGAPASVQSLALGDFDGDGAVDLVATSTNRDLTTFLNGGSRAAAVEAGAPLGLRAVTSPGIGAAAQQAVSADFDGDGRDDVACLEHATGRILVLYGGSPAAAPGAFSDSPADAERFDMRGTGLCALQAVDVDEDGDEDLVGSHLVSQSTSVLCNERFANARKTHSVLHLLGAPASGVVADTFVPDDREFVQAPAASLAPDVALDRFTFRAEAASGERLRLRARVRGLRAGVDVRLGLFDARDDRLRWVQGAAVGTELRELVFVAPDAARFVSPAGDVHAFVLSRAGGQDFRLAIDQLSVEVVP
jgi:hypothetical protein